MGSMRSARETGMGDQPGSFVNETLAGNPRYGDRLKEQELDTGTQPTDSAPVVTPDAVPPGEDSAAAEPTVSTEEAEKNTGKTSKKK